MPLRGLTNKESTNIENYGAYATLSSESRFKKISTTNSKGASTVWEILFSLGCLLGTGLFIAGCCVRGLSGKITLGVLVGGLAISLLMAKVCKDKLCEKYPLLNKSII